MWREEKQIPRGSATPRSAKASLRGDPGSPLGMTTQGMGTAQLKLCPFKAKYWNFSCESTKFAAELLCADGLYARVVTGFVAAGGVLMQDALLHALVDG